jgi:hypothetical protein
MIFCKVTFHKSKKSYQLTKDDFQIFQIAGRGLEDKYSVEVLN